MLSIGVDRSKQLIAEGGSKGRAMTFMAERPNEILTTILVGNNVANIIAASLTTNIAARYFKDDVVSISVFITTFIILIFGEIVPKTIARSNAERLALYVIRILQFIYYLSYPLIFPTSLLIKKMLGENAQIKGRIITKNDIEYMINKAEKERTIDSKQIDLLNSILEFPTIKVKDIMIPRAKVRSIFIGNSFSSIIDFIKKDNHSRYPVCERSLDKTVGFLHVKDLAFVRNETEVKDFDIKKYLKAPFFVYEHMKIQAVFDHMNRKKVHLALVKDENGLVVGIVTLEDIVEEIFGEIRDEHDEDIEEIQDYYDVGDLETGICVDGKISLRDLDSEFEIEIPANDNYSTISGFILDVLGNSFPEQGQVIVWNGYSFELVKVENQEIKEIKIKDINGNGRHAETHANGDVVNASDDIQKN